MALHQRHSPPWLNQRLRGCDKFLFSGVHLPLCLPLLLKLKGVTNAGSNAFVGYENEVKELMKKG